MSQRYSRSNNPGSQQTTAKNLNSRHDHFGKKIPAISGSLVARHRRDYFFPAIPGLPVLVQSIWSLGEIGDKSGIPASREALNDKSLNVRASALLALKKLERD